MEGLYYLSSENKGADQLRGYREADLRLCFRICKKPVFSQRGSYNQWFSNKIASANEIYFGDRYQSLFDFLFGWGGGGFYFTLEIRKLLDEGT